MAYGTYWNLHHLSVVSSNASGRNHQPCRLSARAFYSRIPPQESGTRLEWSGKSTSRGLCPSDITAAAVIAIRYARDLRHYPQLRSALLGFIATSLFAAGIAGFFGALLDKNAPVEGRQTIVWFKENDYERAF